MADRYKASDRIYGEFIAVDNATAIELWKANRSLMASVYGVYQILRHEVNDPGLRKAAVEVYKVNVTSLRNRLELAKANLPASATEIADFEKHTEEILVLTDKAIELSPMGRSFEAYQTVLKADGLILTLSRDLDAFLAKLQAEIVGKSQDLAKRTDRTILGVLATVAIVFALGLVAALVVAIRGIATPIARLREQMTSLADGKTDIVIEGQDRRDEVGQMATAVVVFLDNAVERELLARDAAAEAAEKLARQIRIETQIKEFRSAVGTVLAVVAAQSEKNRESARALSEATSLAGNRAGQAAVASHQISASATQVAAAVDELAKSVGSIAEQAKTSFAKVDDMARAAAATQETISGLANAAERIGAVTGMIKAVCQRRAVLDHGMGHRQQRGGLSHRRQSTCAHRPGDHG